MMSVPATQKRLDGETNGVELRLGDRACKRGDAPFLIIILPRLLSLVIKRRPRERFPNPQAVQKDTENAKYVCLLLSRASREAPGQGVVHEETRTLHDRHPLH
jgi:hypothetical protein